MIEDPGLLVVDGIYPLYYLIQCFKHLSTYVTTYEILLIKSVESKYCIQWLETLFCLL